MNTLFAILPKLFLNPFSCSYRSEATCSSLPPIASKTGLAKFKNPQSWLCSLGCTTRTTSKMPSNSSLRLSQLKSTMSFPRKFQVTEIFLHEDFNHTTRLNDIALLKTSKFQFPKRGPRKCKSITANFDGQMSWSWIHSTFHSKMYFSLFKIKSANSGHFVLILCFFWKGEQVDLFTFPPACLPSQGQSFSRSDGLVAGVKISCHTAIIFMTQRK